ncbi:MAG: TrkH family potassium uptake protein [Clostridiales bacterium]|nr:TrkH family potassium uptake protein [Clostridia bacterium]MCR4883906.1 TrkH family potassium uptake protein [Clostridiales bacterium]
MNILLVLRMLSAILLIESASMIPAIAVAMVHGDGDVLPLVFSALIILAVSIPAYFFIRPKDRNLRVREGFVVVALAWILMSAFGALPYVFSGFLPHFYDAFFESVSGFTTTGATVVSNFGYMPHGIAFWRSFTHWVGGMGVLVLTLALLPKLSDHTSHLVRAESPGPSLSKIVPKMGESAKILYMMYLVLTVAEFICLIVAGMNPYDAAIHAMGTAGTGGFSNYGNSIAHFHSVAVEAVMTTFMILFGINFAIYYFLLTRSWKDIRMNEELRWYLGIVFASIFLLTIFLLPYYGSLKESLRYASFQTASIISTSGFATADFDLWPVQAKMLLLLLTFIGSCAGSTAGGMKVIRVVILAKQGKREIRRTFQPRKVQTIRFDGKAVDEVMLHSIAVFGFAYIFLVLAGAFMISLDGKYDLITNFTASLTCISNVGPGFGAVGPAGGFSGYGPFAKVIASFLMLAGRLELYPMLVLLHPKVWSRT